MLAACPELGKIPVAVLNQKMVEGLSAGDTRLYNRCMRRHAALTQFVKNRDGGLTKQQYVDTPRKKRKGVRRLRPSQPVAIPTPTTPPVAKEKNVAVPPPPRVDIPTTGIVTKDNRQAPIPSDVKKRVETETPPATNKARPRLTPKGDKAE